MTAQQFNDAPKKRGWKGIVALEYEVVHGKVITPCPYGEKTPAQKLADRFRKCGVAIGDAKDVAKVGSQGCACCCYNCGKTGEGHLLCGYKAKKSMWKTDELGLQVGMYKIPRRIL